MGIKVFIVNVVMATIVYSCLGSLCYALPAPPDDKGWLFVRQSKSAVKIEKIRCKCAYLWDKLQMGQRDTCIAYRKDHKKA